MVLDEFVQIKWHSRIKNHYVDSGYVFTKIGDLFLAKINDLTIGSRIKIHVKCDVCGCEKEIRYYVYLHNIKSGGYYGCSNKCSMNKYYNTNIEKYGVKYATELEEIKEKRKQTCRKKYGVEYAQSLKHFVDKRTQTNLERYGIEYPSKLNRFQEKRRETNLERYGVEYPQQLESNKEKYINTMIEKYGEIYVKYAPKYNLNSVVYFDILSRKLNLLILHALNGGEKKFIRYYVDGYIEKYNICIEWDEKAHNSNKQKEMDVKRETFLKENFYCKIIRINEEKFLNDATNQINVICDEINTIIVNKKHGK